MMKYPRKLDNKLIFTPDLLFAWAERTRLEMDAFDVVIPKLLEKKQFQEIIEVLAKNKIPYEKARENVRARLKEVDEDMNLYNAGVRDIEKNIWN